MNLAILGVTSVRLLMYMYVFSCVFKDRDRRRKPHKTGLTGLNSVKTTLDTEFDSQQKPASGAVNAPLFKPSGYSGSSFLNSNSLAETDDRAKTPPSDRSGRSSSRSDSSSHSVTASSKPKDKDNDILTIEDVLSADTRKRGSRYNRNRDYANVDIPVKTNTNESNGTYDVRRSSITNDVPVRSANRERSPKDFYSSSAAKSKPKATTRVGDLEIGDIDDLEDDLEDLQVAPKVPAPRSMMPLQKSQPIDIETAAVSLYDTVLIHYSLGNQ